MQFLWRHNYDFLNCVCIIYKKMYSLLMTVYDLFIYFLKENIISTYTWYDIDLYMIRYQPLHDKISTYTFPKVCYDPDTINSTISTYGLPRRWYWPLHFPPSRRYPLQQFVWLLLSSLQNIIRTYKQNIIRTYKQNIIRTCITS